MAVPDSYRLTEKLPLEGTADGGEAVRLVAKPPAAADRAVTDRSGTVTLGGTAQTVAAANTSRRFFLLQNLSAEVLWLNIGVTAVADQPSIALKACDVAGDGTGGVFRMGGGDDVFTALVSIIGATTGSKFTAKEG